MLGLVLGWSQPDLVAGECGSPLGVGTVGVPLPDLSPVATPSSCRGRWSFCCGQSWACLPSLVLLLSGDRRHLHHAVAVYPLRLRLRACCRRAEDSVGRRSWCGLVGMLGRAGWACGVSPAGSGLPGGYGAGSCRIWSAGELLELGCRGHSLAVVGGLLLSWVIGRRCLNPLARGAVVRVAMALVLCRGAAGLRLLWTAATMTRQFTAGGHPRIFFFCLGPSGGKTARYLA